MNPPSNSNSPSAARQQYVRQVIDDYCRTPQTLGRARPGDRRLAAQLYDRGIPAVTVQSAFLLAAARRSLRDPAAVPLEPIRSMHYFLPVIEEIIHHPLPPDYLQYLKEKLKSVLREA